MHLFFLVFPATLGSTWKKTFGVGDRLLKKLHAWGAWLWRGLQPWWWLGLHGCWIGNRRAGASFPDREREKGQEGGWGGESLAMGGYIFLERKAGEKRHFREGGKRRDFQIRATFFLLLLAAVQSWVPVAGVGLPRCRKCMLHLMYLSHSFY